MRDAARHAPRALAGFATALKFECHDLVVGLDLPPQPGVADTSDLDLDLADLRRAAAAAAQAADSALVLLLDELQYVSADQLGSLLVALRAATQDKLPVLLIGAGLP